MKQLALIILIPAISFAEDVNIYKYNQFGVRDVFPSYEVQDKGRYYDVYRKNGFGVREVYPEQRIDKPYDRVNPENNISPYRRRLRAILQEPNSDQR